MKTLTVLEGIVLPDADDNDVRLSDLWADQHVVFVWLRHYG